MSKESKKKLTIIGIPILAIILEIWVLALPGFVPKHSRAASPSNRIDYVSSCYLLEPKKNAYFYSGKNKFSKLYKIDSVVIPAKVAVGQTVFNDEGFFNGNSHKGNPFLESSSSSGYNVDFKNNITENPSYSYPLDQSNVFIKVADFKHIYQYFLVESFSSKRHYFVLPTKFHEANYSDKQPTLSTYYLNLDEFNISYHKKFNLTKSNARIVVGYVDKNAN